MDFLLPRNSISGDICFEFEKKSEFQVRSPKFKTEFEKRINSNYSEFEIRIRIWNLNLYANVPTDTLYTVPILDASFWEEKSQENDSFLEKKARNSLQTTYTSGRTDMKIENHGFPNEEQTWDQKSRPSCPIFLVFLDNNMYFQ